MTADATFAAASVATCAAAVAVSLAAWAAARAAPLVRSVAFAADVRNCVIISLTRPGLRRGQHAARAAFGFPYDAGPREHRST
jgi:hypothetical protein